MAWMEQYTATVEAYKRMTEQDKQNELSKEDWREVARELLDDVQDRATLHRVVMILIRQRDKERTHN